MLAFCSPTSARRAAGETDIGPVGTVGTLTQIIFSGYGTLATVVTGWLSMGSSSQAVQTLWAFRAGQRLGASPRAQIGAQVLGALLGGAVVVPVYILIVNAYGIANATMPAPSAVGFKATAQAVHGGWRRCPTMARGRGDRSRRRRGVDASRPDASGPVPALAGGDGHRDADALLAQHDRASGALCW